MHTIQCYEFLAVSYEGTGLVFLGLSAS